MAELENSERSRFPWAFAVGTGVVLAVLGVALFFSRTSGEPGGAGVPHLPLGPAEQEYLAHVHVQGVQLFQATNLLNQEFTYVNGVLSNEGIRTMRDAELTVEFRDSLNQVVLRETQRIVGPGGRVIQGGERRDFQITLESVPSEWNHEYPSVRVTGMQLE